MRAFILTLSLIFTYSTLATDYNLPDDVQLVPKCSSLSVRLSPTPVPCLPDNMEDRVFDIPELKLDIEELQKIFEGAESSGGHVIGPMHTPRMGNTNLPFSVNYRCEARLLLDGKKIVSFLLTNKFSLSDRMTQGFLAYNSWEVGIIKGSNIFSEEILPVQTTLPVRIENFDVGIKYVKEVDKIKIKACSINRNIKFLRKNCAESYHKKGEVLQVLYKNEYQNKKISIDKTLMVTCLPH